MAPIPGTSELEARVMRKVAWRLMPLFGLGYLINATGGYEMPMLIVGSVVLLAGLAVPLAARAAEARRGVRLEAA